MRLARHTAEMLGIAGLRREGRDSRMLKAASEVERPVQNYEERSCGDG